MTASITRLIFANGGWYIFYFIFLNMRQLLLLLFLLASQSLQAQFTVTAEIRPRFEYRHGFKRLVSDNEKPALFIEQRSRLNLGYQQDKIRVGLQVQDVRIWGETAQINKSDGLFSVHQAWGEVLFTNRLSLKVGRQELVYDDQRILGSLDWAAQGRSHDAARLMWQDSTWQLHLGLAFNQNSDLPEPAKLTGNFYNAPGGFSQLGGGLPNYKNLRLLWTEKKLGKLDLIALVLNTGWQMPDTTVNYVTTVGFNPALQLSSRLKLNGSLYYQFGKNRADQSVQAYLASVAFTYSGIKSFTLTLGGDMVSGTDVNESKSTTFDPLFGTHHKFYGQMDYFYVGNPHSQNGKSVGLVDAFLKTKARLGERSALLAELHQFSSQVPVADPNDLSQTLNSNLGGEFDLIYNLDYQPNINVKIGYAQMFATSSMEAIKGGNRDQLNHWAWAMITFKPNFLDKK